MDIPPPPPSRPFPGWIRWTLLGLSVAGTLMVLVFQAIAWAQVKLPAGSEIKFGLATGAIVALLGALMFLQRALRYREGESLSDRRNHLLVRVKQVPVWRVITFVLLMGYVGWTFMDPKLSQQRIFSPFLFNYGAALLILLPLPGRAPTE